MRSIRSLGVVTTTVSLSAAGIVRSVKEKCNVKAETDAMRCVCVLRPRTMLTTHATDPSGTQIGEAGATVLSESLQHYGRLQELYLNQNLQELYLIIFIRIFIILATSTSPSTSSSSLSSSSSPSPHQRMIYSMRAVPRPE